MGSIDQAECESVLELARRWATGCPAVVQCGLVPTIPQIPPGVWSA